MEEVDRGSPDAVRQKGKKKKKKRNMKLERGSYDHLKACHWPFVCKLAFDFHSLVDYQFVTLG